MTKPHKSRPVGNRVDDELSVYSKDGEDDDALAEIEGLVDEFNHHKDTTFCFSNQAPEANAHSLQKCL